MAVKTKWKRPQEWLRSQKELPEVLEGLREMRRGNHDLKIMDPAKFVVKSMASGSPSGYGLEVKGQLMPFGMDGIKTLTHLLSMDWNYFSKFPNKEELIEHINLLLPSKIKGWDGVLVRLTGTGAVRAVLPGKYTILDDEQVLEIIMGVANQTLGKIRGVVATSDRWDNSIYRLCFGDSFLKNDEVYPCVNIRNSEIGGPLSLGFGTFRVKCTNGMIDGSGYGKILSWGHRGKFDKSVQKIGTELRLAEEWVSPIKARIEDSKTVTIKQPGGELDRLVKAGWINEEISLTAKGLLNEDLANGADSGGATKMGIWNALTATARGYRPVQRAKIEQIAHRYLMLGT